MKGCRKALKSDWTRKMLFRYAAMYALAVGIVLALLIPIRREMYNMNYNAIVEDGREQIAAGLSMFDSTVNMMCNSADMLTDLDEYAVLRKWKGVGGAELSFSINEIRGALGKLIFMREEYVKGVYVTFSRNELFLSNFASALSYYDIYPRLFSYRSLPVEAWYGEMFLNERLIHILPEQTVESGDNYFKEFQCITCVVHPWTEDRYASHSAVSFMLDAQALMESFAVDGVMEGGYVRLSDTSGNLIAERGADRLRENDCVMLESGNHEYLRVAVGIPREMIANKISSITAILKICIYTGLFGMLVLLGAVLLSNNLNVYRMLQISRKYADAPLAPMRRMRSFDYVKETIAQIAASRTAAERRALLIQNSWNNEALVNACLRGLLTSAEAANVSRLLGDIRERYVVVLIESAQEAGGGSVIWAEEFMRAHLRCAAVSFYPDESTLALILPAEEPEGEKGIRGALEALCEMCRAKDSGMLSIGMSGIAGGVDRLNAAYEQARMAMRLNNMDGRQDFAAYEKGLGVDAEICIGVDLLSKLSDLVVMGEDEEVGRIFDEICATGFDESGSVLKYMYVFSAVRMALLNAGRVILRDEDAGLPDFRADESPLDAMNQCRACALALCRRVREKRRSNNTVLRQSIADYIAANFRDVNLSSDQIAEQFSISRTYALQFVRMQFGKSLNEYVEDVRLDEVERLLAQTNSTIDEIMKETGYISQNTLYRAFKKRHGVTPGKWREMLQ